MSLLVAVKSSEKEMVAGTHDRVRATVWYQAMRGKAVVKFFIGRETSGGEGRIIVGSRVSYNYKSDECDLDVVDQSADVFKTRAISRYVASKNIDHVLMVDTNSVVLPEKVWGSHYAVADYSGIFDGGWGEFGPREVNGHVVERCYSWASGKAGYFLSRRAAFEVADSTVNIDQRLRSNDDFWVGQILGPMCATGDLFSIQLDESVCK